MLEDRRLAVLRAIVEDYVATHEPVGSKALVDRHNLGVSPATIRNDMAALEDEGYITHPHTSAGRVPTDRGYRLFVDQLSHVKPMSAAERKAIERFLGDAVDLDDVMARTVRLLAQLTQQVALVQYPSLQRSSVRHVELIAVSETRAMLVVIMDTGRVEQRVIECAEPLSEDVLGDLRAKLNAAVANKPFAFVPEALQDLDQTFAPEDRNLVQAVMSAVLEAVTERLEERVVLGGTAHLARYQQSFPMAIQPVLEALEEQVILLRLLGELSIESPVTVRIGQETDVQGLESTSVVTAGYGRSDKPVASLGIVGPTHMDYPGTMSAVHAVAQYVSKILNGQ